MNVKPPITAPKELNIEDRALDIALRPQSFNEYIGQQTIKDNLRIALHSAAKRKEAPEHILLHGPSGLGKTTLAYLIARELNTNIRITSGTALQKAGDVGAILTGLHEGDVLFIDEVHRLPRAVEEVIYPALEDFQLDIILGKGTGAKTLRLDVPRFTLVAATTRISELSSPFRSRFGMSFRLDYYTKQDIEKIITRSARILKIPIDSGGIGQIAASARNTPRVANRLLKRVRDYAQFHQKTNIDPKLVSKSLEMLEIDPIGLEETDRRILKAIAETFRGGPVGVRAIAASIAEEERTIVDVYEPYLLQIGFLARTPQGRIITDTGRAHLVSALSAQKIRK